jgi:hypothetical protein
LRRSEKVGRALHMVFFGIWIYILWSCRGGCSESRWFLVGIYPVLVILYVIERRRITKRILSEIPGYQQSPAERPKENGHGQNQ